jgi:hypothetical protein
MDQTGNRRRVWDRTLHLVEVVIRWLSVAAPIVHAATARSRSQSEPRRALDRPKTCTRRSDDTDARYHQGAQGSDAEHLQAALRQTGKDHGHKLGLNLSA